MGEFIKQCKGLDSDKVSVSDNTIFYSSIKYDGVYIQIHKNGKDVKFFTSSGKEFFCTLNYLFFDFDFDFIVEAEYICDGGKLGNRTKADNEIKKAVKDSSFDLTGEFKIFDILNVDLIYSDRLDKFSNKFGSMFCENDIITYKEAKQNLKYVSADGWEGLFLKKATHRNMAGKKSKDAIKLKNKLTADLVCVGWDGSYLLLQDDNELTAKVIATGMEKYISKGDIVEIEYEQIIQTYNQAKFKCIRYDKMS